ncbi:alpha/beta fold hydrolase [Nocardia africana]|uniref:Haloacetate dehalogenase H-1 n=1 Tax=Nocardia africana TaxID=134964 RepID=A0A378WWK0_9NOCA|nr:alpha/beta hydrolase [Nocardia africana]MCC3313608.1 alpha/beta hydrolase [Nocardia africana]SUA45015.1 Haloacetate dehalogenase H-1 [Nocardia africana]
MSTSSPATRRFRSDTAELEALTWGDPCDPAALLVHGFPDSAWTWEEIGPALAATGRYVVAPFTRGYAPSSLATDDDYSIASLVDDIVAIHRAIGADRRAIVVGHDWGGAIVSALTAAHPELFHRSVLIAIPPLPTIKALFTPSQLSRHLPRLARQAPRSWYMTVVSIPWLSDTIGGWLIDRLWQAWAPVAPVGRQREQGLLALAGRARRRAAFSYYRAVWNPLYRRSAGHRYEQLAAFAPPRVPTLYLQGTDDTCGLVDTGADALDHLPPGSCRTLVPAAGHFAHLEQPETVLEHIIAFVGKGA